MCNKKCPYCKRIQLSEDLFCNNCLANLVPEINIQVDEGGY
jgi:hypothetical protein